MRSSMSSVHASTVCQGRIAVKTQVLDREAYQKSMLEKLVWIW